MQSLENFYGKYVRIVDADNLLYTGYVGSFTSAADNDEEKEESIGISPNKEVDYGVELYRSEIKSIEIYNGKLPSKRDWIRNA